MFKACKTSPSITVLDELRTGGGGNGLMALVLCGGSSDWLLSQCELVTCVREGCNSPHVLQGQSMAGQLMGQRCVCVCAWLGILIIIPSPVHVSQLLEAGSPVIEVVIVLVPCAGGVERANRAGSGAAALIVKNQQGVIWRSCGVVVCSSQTLKRTGKGSQSLNSHISSTHLLSTSTFSCSG